MRPDENNIPLGSAGPFYGLIAAANEYIRHNSHTHSLNNSLHSMKPEPQAIRRALIEAANLPDQE